MDYSKLMDHQRDEKKRISDLRKNKTMLDAAVNQYLAKDKIDEDSSDEDVTNLSDL